MTQDRSLQAETGNLKPPASSPVGSMSMAAKKTLTKKKAVRRPKGTAKDVLDRLLPLRIRALHDGHRTYLPWHRERVFKGDGASLLK
jgi:hypothetical protein